MGREQYMEHAHDNMRILRERGPEVAEIASLPEQQQANNRWKQRNGLKPVRPMVMIDQIPWYHPSVVTLAGRTINPVACTFAARLGPRAKRGCIGR